MRYLECKEGSTELDKNNFCSYISKSHKKVKEQHFLIRYLKKIVLIKNWVYRYKSARISHTELLCLGVVPKYFLTSKRPKIGYHLKGFEGSNKSEKKCFILQTIYNNYQ